MTVQTFRNISVAIALAGVVACSSPKAPRPPSGGGGGAPLEFPRQESKSEEQVDAARAPWEAWPYAMTLQGAPIKDASFLHADELVRAGDRTGALAEYQRIPPAGLSPAEREALAIRIASIQLTLGQPEASLVTLSRYFSAANLNAEQVNPYFSVLFGYAYGRHGDLDQSLAWFSRATRIPPEMGVPSLAAAAEGGVRLVLRTIPTSAIPALVDRWDTDPFVRRLVGEEAKRRSAVGGYEPTPEIVARLWNPEQTEPVQGPSSAEVVLSGGTVGVMLPASGRFGNVGASLKNGIELAFQGQGNASLQPSFTDSSDDPLQAVARARELMASGSVRALLGPVQADLVAPLSDLAREFNVPMVSFSKNAGVTTGGDLFRFAPTVENQVESLLATAVDVMHLSRFAVVYPDEAQGAEFARVFKEAVAHRGSQLVFEGTYGKSNTEGLLGLAKDLEGTQPEAVFLPDTLLTASRFSSALSPEGKQKIRLLGPLSWDDMRQLTNSRAALEGVIFVSPFFAGSGKPAIQQFVQSYTSRYGKAPDFLAAQGFDAATLLANAYQRAAEHALPLAEALRTLPPYDGLTGLVQVEASGDIDRRFAVVQFIDGGYHEVLEPPPVPSYVYRENTPVNVNERFQSEGANAPAVPTAAPSAAPPIGSAPSGTQGKTFEDRRLEELLQRR